MLSPLKFLLNNQLKLTRFQLSRKTDGFTLIELLVGLALAFLVITPLLGFMINTLSTDRQEQAKANSEQEIQVALNYIARDLDQAVFIYDGFALDNIKTQLPALPTGTKGVPVLVFWKRQFFSDALPIKGAPPNCPNQAKANPDLCDDGYVYSLVAYYLIKSDPCNNSIWSCTARIGRVQLTDKVKDINNNPNNILKPESDGFQPFFPPPVGLPASATFEQKMNAWQRSASGNINNNPIEILIDYIDHTPQSPAATAAGLTPPDCSNDPRDLPRPDVTNPPAGYVPAAYTHRQVPTETSLTSTFQDQINSFYACVSTDKTTAQVFIRGNALARIRPKTSPPTYTAGQAAYFPRASIQAKGRGLVNDNKTSK
jgi:type II secretory pathway pseudopilin PulG